MTLVTVSSAGKPMVPKNNNGGSIVCQHNGIAYVVPTDVQSDQPNSVIALLQNSGFSTS